MYTANKLKDCNFIIQDDIYLSLADKEKYIEEFNALKSEGIINLDNSFEDDSWDVTVVEQTTRINFTIDEVLFKRITKNRKINLSYEEFSVGIRRYIIEMIYTGRAIPTCAAFIGYVKRILSETDFLDINKIKNMEKISVTPMNIAFYERLQEFLQFILFDIPVEYEIIYENIELKPWNTRKLPNFISIFNFIDIIKEFEENATQDELVKFFPIILWWKISSIIPLRPSELMLMKYNCNDFIKDKYYIKIRRSNKKGHPKKYRENDFNIDNYYREDIVEITKDIYDEIEFYKQIIKENSKENKKTFLFSLELYLKTLNKGNNGSRINYKRMTSDDLTKLLNRFYIEIVNKKFGKVLLSRYENNIKLLDSKTYIETLTPYDTRHIAIINLILMGNEHYTVMKLAGHESIKTTIGYFDHLEEYANAYSINYAKYLITKRVNKYDDIDDIADENIVNSKISKWRKVSGSEKNLTKIDGGYCSYHLNDFNPCFSAKGIHARCPYFYEDDIQIQKDELNKVSQKLDSDIKALRYLVKNANNISDFSQRYSVLTQSIREDMNIKGFLITKNSI